MAESVARRVFSDNRGPLSQLRAYLAEWLIGLALDIDFEAAYGFVEDLAKLRERT
jgi:hypothetical protein